MPGQFLLQYYTDQTARKLKGIIDLDQCEQVDTGLTFECGKLRFQWMFDIKTPSRVYYLAADSEAVMARWVECVCRVCGLHSCQSDTEAESDKVNTATRSASPATTSRSPPPPTQAPPRPASHPTTRTAPPPARRTHSTPLGTTVSSSLPRRPG